MQTYTQTFTGPTTWQLNVPGRYFTILLAATPLNVRFYRGGKMLDLGEIKQLLSGLECTFDNVAVGDFAFDRVEIDVGASGTFQVGVGNGQARYNRSNGTVDINSLQAAAAAIIQRPEPYTIAAQAAMAAGAVQVVSPATNVNGLFIQNLEASGLATANGYGTLLAKSSAPANLTDGDLLANAGYSSVYTSNGIQGRVSNIIVPAGKGIYFYGTAGSTYSTGNICCLAKAL